MICSMMSPIKEFLPLSFFFCFFSHYSDCCMFFSGNVYVCRQGRSSQGRPGWIVKPLPSQISGFGSQLASSSCSNPLTLDFAEDHESSCLTFVSVLTARARISSMFLHTCRLPMGIMLFLLAGEVRKFSINGD
ncbi:hypothetical protein SETIT_2G138100v2 [Setaria italica]|uniref:Secreted protein n=1 Tax=Setaria italica TaxID=4555 RepID=K3ZY09_SETIT|nr:hypothetical protein SETIT_2G138100v2 [Setaria italica]